MIPYPSGKFNKVCFLYFSEKLQRLNLTSDPRLYLDLEFGNTDIVCDIPSNYGLPFCEV